MRTSISSLIASLRLQGTLLTADAPAAAAGAARGVHSLTQEDAEGRHSRPETSQSGRINAGTRHYSQTVPDAFPVPAASLGAAAAQQPAASQHTHQLLDQLQQHDVPGQTLASTSQSRAFNQAELAVSIIRDLAKKVRTLDTASLANQRPQLESLFQAMWPAANAAIQAQAPIQHVAELIYSLGCLHEKQLLSAAETSSVKASMDTLVDQLLAGGPGLPHLSRSFLGLSRLGFTSTSRSSRRLAAAAVSVMGHSAGSISNGALISDREAAAVETSTQNLLRTAVRLSLPTSHPLVYQLVQLVTVLAGRSPAPTSPATVGFAPTVIRSLAVLGWSDPAPYLALTRRAVTQLGHMQPDQIQILETALQAAIRNVRPARGRHTSSPAVAAAAARQTLAMALSTARAARTGSLDAQPDADWWDVSGVGLGGAGGGGVKGLIDDVLMHIHMRHFQSAPFQAAISQLREALQLGPLPALSINHVMRALVMEGAVGTGPDRPDLLDIGQKPPGPQLFLDLEQHVLQHVTEYCPADVAALTVAAVQNSACSGDYQAHLVKHVVHVVGQLTGDQLAHLTQVLSQQQPQGRERVYAALCHRVLYEEPKKPAAVSSSRPSPISTSRPPTATSTAPPTMPSAVTAPAGPPSEAALPMPTPHTTVTAPATHTDLLGAAADTAPATHTDLPGAAAGTAPASSHGTAPASSHGTAPATSHGTAPSRQVAANQLQWQQVQGSRQLVTDGRTSLVVFNVPPNITLPDFKHLVDEGPGCQGRYDFLHMPFVRGKDKIDPSTGTVGWFAGKRGYAFINMADMAAVEALAQHLHGREITVGGLTKVMEVRYADKQGLTALLAACKVGPGGTRMSAGYSPSKGPYVLPIKPVAAPAGQVAPPASQWAPPAGQQAPPASFEGLQESGGSQVVQGVQGIAPDWCPPSSVRSSAVPAPAAGAQQEVGSVMPLAGQPPHTAQHTQQRSGPTISLQNLARIANSLAADNYLHPPFFTHIQRVLALPASSSPPTDPSGEVFCAPPPREHVMHSTPPPREHVMHSAHPPREHVMHSTPQQSSPSLQHLCQPGGSIMPRAVAHRDGGTGSGTRHCWTDSQTSAEYSSAYDNHDNAGTSLEDSATCSRPAQSYHHSDASHHSNTAVNHQQQQQQEQVTVAGVDDSADHVLHMLAALSMYAAKCQHQWWQQVMRSSLNPPPSWYLPEPTWPTCYSFARDTSDVLVDPAVVSQALHTSAHVLQSVGPRVSSGELSVEGLKRLVATAVATLQHLLEACKLYDAAVASPHNTTAAPTLHEPPAPPLSMTRSELQQQSVQLCRALGRLLHQEAITRLGLCSAVTDAVWVLSNLGHADNISLDQLGEVLLASQTAALTTDLSYGASAPAPGSASHTIPPPAEVTATSTTTAAAAVLGPDHTHPLLAGPAPRPFCLLTPSQLSKLTWTLGSHAQCVQWRKPEVAQVLVKQVVHQLHHMTGPQATDILWGLSQLRAASESVIQTFLGHLSHCYDLHLEHLKTLHHVLHMRQQQTQHVAGAVRATEGFEERHVLAGHEHQGLPAGMSAFLQQLLRNAVKSGAAVEAHAARAHAREQQHAMAAADHTATSPDMPLSPSAESAPSDADDSQQAWQLHSPDAGDVGDDDDLHAPRVALELASSSSSAAASSSALASMIHRPSTGDSDAAPVAVMPMWLTTPALAAGTNVAYCTLPDEDMALLHMLQRFECASNGGGAADGSGSAPGGRHDQRWMQVVASVRSLVMGTLLNNTSAQRHIS